MVTLRSATSSDLDDLVNLDLEVVDKEKRKAIHKKRLKEAEDKSSNEYLIASRDNVAVGHVLVSYKEREYPIIEGLFIRNNLREQGLGTEIIKLVEERIKNKGFNKIGLSVNPTENKRAKELYERLGYKQNKDLYLGYVDPWDKGQDWIIDMVKEL